MTPIKNSKYCSRKSKNSLIVRLLLLALAPQDPIFKGKVEGFSD